MCNTCSSVEAGKFCQDCGTFKEPDVVVPQTPLLLPEPDLVQLRKQVMAYVTADTWDNDEEHYIFEAAMEAFYGETIWSYLNARKSRG